MKNINKYFLIIIVVSIIVFLYSGYIANKQVEQRKNDYSIYVEIKKMIEENKASKESIKQLNQLQTKYKESYVFDIDKALIYKSLGEKEKALQEIENAFEKNQGLYKNASVLVIYAELSYLNGKEEKTKEIISKAHNIGIPSKYQELVDSILSELK